MLNCESSTILGTEGTDKIHCLLKACKQIYMLRGSKFYVTKKNQHKGIVIMKQVGAVSELEEH